MDASNWSRRLRAGALAALLPVVVPSAAHAAAAAATGARDCRTTELGDPGFESQPDATVIRPWQAEGTVHVVSDPALAHRGSHFAEPAGADGWNAVRQSVYLRAGAPYRLNLWVRTSPGLGSAVVGVREGAAAPLVQLRVSAPDEYRHVELNFRPAHSGNHRIYAGFDGPGTNAWMRIDDVTLQGSCGMARDAARPDGQLPFGVSPGTRDAPPPGPDDAGTGPDAAPPAPGQGARTPAGRDRAMRP